MAVAFEHSLVGSAVPVASGLVASGFVAPGFAASGYIASDFVASGFVALAVEFGFVALECSEREIAFVHFVASDASEQLVEIGCELASAPIPHRSASARYIPFAYIDYPPPSTYPCFAVCNSYSRLPLHSIRH